MITQNDLQAAIAECKGAPNPNANTCIKLAAYYTIQEHLFGERPEQPIFSESPEPKSITISAISDSEFSDAINGKDLTDVLYVLDDLMQAVSVLNPRLYAATLRKLSDT